MKKLKPLNFRHEPCKTFSKQIHARLLAVRRLTTSVVKMWTTRLSASAPAVLILSALCVHQMIFKTVLNASWNDSRVKAVIWWHLQRTDHVVCQLNQLSLEVFRNIELRGRLLVNYQVRFISFFRSWSYSIKPPFFVVCFVFFRQGMQTNRRCRICHWLIWKHWT